MLFEDGNWIDLTLPQRSYPGVGRKRSGFHGARGSLGGLFEFYSPSPSVSGQVQLVR